MKIDRSLHRLTLALAVIGLAAGCGLLSFVESIPFLLHNPETPKPVPTAPNSGKPTP